MTTTYTPGPWRWDGRMLLGPDAREPYYSAGMVLDYDLQEPKEADARLIAAAPEMATLLEYLAQAGPMPANGTTRRALVSRSRVLAARALLARIRGEE